MGPPVGKNSGKVGSGGKARREIQQSGEAVCANSAVRGGRDERHLPLRNLLATH
jgi:hypothetical protein